jgi:hypothetical protein
MNRTFALTIALLATTTAAHAQPAGTGVTAPGTMADSLYVATPAPTDSLAPVALPATPNTVPPTALSTTPMPARPHVLMIRTEPVIRVERDQLRVLGEGADVELAAAKRARLEVRGTIEIKKKDIDALGARAKAAKQARDDAARTSIDEERKRQESVRGYFERLLDVHDAAMDEAQARVEYARAAIRACDWELQLVGRSGVAANDGDPALFKAEQQYFDAVKARGVAQERFANRLQTLSDRKLRLYRAWADWLGGR